MRGPGRADRVNAGSGENIVNGGSGYSECGVLAGSGESGYIACSVLGEKWVES
ncbi:unnamed protein product [Staurois parvus]|uniref:Uncharacterized protein n=1 Tax=Staurois parvus TaxID=386267 RepID=A0ABN9FYC6_9NEOB|nr:unnamed protein product [Staurois parvus]